MTRLFSFFLLISLAGLLFAASDPEPKFEPLPVPLSNNPMTSVNGRHSSLVFSLMGIGAAKTWDAISNSAYVMNMQTRKWSQIHPVPGTAGRLGASAVSARGLVFLLGGYVVDGQGEEITVADVNVYAPEDNLWYRGEDIPLAVDDSVAGVYRDRYIYLVGGWSKTDAVRNVQVYDIEKKKWFEATPLPGTPVFGHAGALVDDTILYVDGAYKNPAGASPKYISSDECWLGKIDHHDPAKIQWSKVPNHPGTARYRIAAGGSAKDEKIYFSGGTDNPYNFNGIGYNGQPSEPSPVTFAYDLRGGKWETITENTPNPTMDHRGLVVLPQGLLIAGGMEAGQQVTSRVQVIPTPGKGK